jgi:hypothetical protein
MKGDSAHMSIDARRLSLLTSPTSATEANGKTVLGCQHQPHQPREGRRHRRQRDNGRQVHVGPRRVCGYDKVTSGQGSGRHRLTPLLTPLSALHAETSGNREQGNQLI